MSAIKLTSQPAYILESSCLEKLYDNLVTILSKSGVGWNDTEKSIEASNETCRHEYTCIETQVVDLLSRLV